MKQYKTILVLLGLFVIISSKIVQAQYYIILTSPNGGENWQVGSLHNISWSSNGLALVRIDYSTNAGENWINIVQSTSGYDSYNWSIPNSPSETCLVRVSSATNAKIYDQSDSVFSISQIPVIQLLSPNGQENWIVGSVHNIIWSSNNIADVSIDYSTNSGKDWINIIDSTPSVGSYPWTIPNTTSTNCKVRISDATNSNITDQSNDVFRISSPSITLTSPNGGEDWVVGSLHNITWISNDVDYVDIDYSTNNGENWIGIIKSAPSVGSYSWTIPITPSKNCRVRINDASNYSLTDQSNNLFTISLPSVTLTSPNGRENWFAGSQQYIKWTSSNIEYIRLEYSTNSGEVWLPIVSGTPAKSESYMWLIPNTPSSNCLVQISDVSKEWINDRSDNTFTISSRSINVISPNGGEEWLVGSSHNITWNSTDVANVKIELSTNNGGTWIGVAQSVPSSGTYNWTIPNLPSTNCRIKLTDASNDTIFDQSNNVFTISVPSISVISPNGGENWYVGSSHNITWNSTNITNVRLDYSTDNGETWLNIIQSTPSSGTYSWFVPNTPSTTCKVRISDSQNATISDQSESIFNISTPTISVTSPNGGENWYVGSSYNITWISAGVANVKIDYTTNNGDTWTNIVSNTPSNGSYNWIVPNTESTNCRVRISDVTNSLVTDQSDNIFTINQLLPPSIIVTSPNGAEEWQIGTIHNITWTSNGVSNVNIDYSTNNGETWSNIIQSTTSDGLFSWTVPNTPSSNCIIRISDPFSELADQSDEVFTIIIQQAPEIILTSPNGGENWQVGSVHNITWTSVNVTSINIDYSTNNGEVWINIIQSTPSDGVFNWTIPNTPSTNCIIRISDPFSELTDQSNDAFTISSELSPIANFTASPVKGLKPLVVKFTDLSSNKITNRVWDFGDGSIGNEQSPTHTYNKSGIYTVLLTVTGPGGSDSLKKTNLVTVDSLIWNAPYSINPGYEAAISTIIPDYFNPTDYILFYRMGGQINFSQSVFQLNNNSLFADIPQEFITIRGVEFYTKITEGEKIYTFPEIDPVNHPAVINVNLPNIAPAVSFQSIKYEMISIPLILKNKSLLNYLIDAYGEYNKNNWRLLRWNDNSASYLEYPKINIELKPGVAFWLITKNGSSFNLSDVQSINTSGPFIINLEKGWNQIGNPFAFTVAWDSIQNLSQVQGPIAWNSSTEDYEPNKQILLPWKGYWVYNFSESPVSLIIPPVESEVIKKENLFNDINPNEFVLQIKAYDQNGSQDIYNYVGMLNNAKDEIDKFDVLEPPSISDKIKLSIIRNQKEYIQNITAVSSEGNYWDLNVSTDKSSKNVSIEIEKKSPLPKEFEIWLLDKNRMLSIPIVKDKSELLLPKTGIGNYRLIVGKKEYAEQNAEQIPLTVPQYSLLQNYPNPFNSTTSIIYNLHEKSKVTIDVFDILGRRVKRLANNEYQNPGLHNVVWDGTNFNFGFASSGIYIYRIKANEFIDSKKMVLLK